MPLFWYVPPQAGAAFFFFVSTKQGGGVQSRNGSIPFLVANVGRTTRTTRTTSRVANPNYFRVVWKTRPQILSYFFKPFYFPFTTQYRANYIDPNYLSTRGSFRAMGELCPIANYKARCQRFWKETPNQRNNTGEPPKS